MDKLIRAKAIIPHHDKDLTLMLGVPACQRIAKLRNQLLDFDFIPGVLILRSKMVEGFRQILQNLDRYSIGVLNYFVKQLLCDYP